MIAVSFLCIVLGFGVSVGSHLAGVRYIYAATLGFFVFVLLIGINAFFVLRKCKEDNGD